MSRPLARWLGVLPVLVALAAGCGGRHGAGGGAPEAPRNLDAPTGLSYADPEIVVTQLSPVAPRTPTVTGTVSSWTVRPALPTGLTLDPVAGVLSGTPLDASARTPYTVTASNAAGETTAQVAITVTALLPPPGALAYPVARVTGTVGTQLTQVEPSVEGAVSTWSVDPALPTGILLGAASGALYGTPQAVSPRTTYTVTASNASGEAHTTIEIEVLPRAPTFLVYDRLLISGTVGQAIAPDGPAPSSVPIDSYRVSPPLPAGLALDPGTGVISGTPQAVAPEAEYRVTAANASGETSCVLRITVEAPVTPPAGLRYEREELVLTRSVDFVSDPAHVTGRVTSWSVDPALPSGLSFGAASGAIWGTAFVASPRTAYVVTAANEAGEVRTTLHVTVNDTLQPPSGLVYRPSTLVADEGVAIPGERPIVLGTVTRWSVAPALPAGLRLSPTTGAISGTPAAPSAAADYTVTAANDAGSTAGTVRIEVRAAETPPTGLSYAPSTIVATVGQPIAPIAPTFQGVVSRWSASPALPDGLAIASTAVVSSTPSTSPGKGPYSSFSFALDRSGNAYRCENRLLKLAPDGTVTALAGSVEAGYADGDGPAARFDGAEDVAVDGDGNVYVADTNNHAIRKVTPAGRVTTLAGRTRQLGWRDGPGDLAQFYLPWGIAVDRAGNVYVSEAGNAAIRKITPAGVVSTLAGSATERGSADGGGATARFYGARGVAVDASGVVYVADSRNSTIRRITADGLVTTLAGSPGVQGSGDGAGSGAFFWEPWDVEVDASGNLLVADRMDDTIRSIAPTGDVTTLAGKSFEAGTTDGLAADARFFRPSAIAVDPLGVVYVTEVGPVRKIDRRPGIVYGTPAAAAAPATYTIEASNSAGSTRATLQITCRDPAVANAP